MPLTLREYTPADRDACRALWRELTERHRLIYNNATIGGEHPEDRFDEYLRTEGLAGPWLAEDDGEVLGMAGLIVKGAEAELEPVVVREPFRSRGVGTRLIERVRDEARARNVRHLSVRPVARNVAAIACFHRAGFTLLGHLDMFMPLTGSDDQEWLRELDIHGNKFGY